MMDVLDGARRLVFSTVFSESGMQGPDQEKRVAVAIVLTE
jgi:hypothetical protein